MIEVLRARGLDPQVRGEGYLVFEDEGRYALFVERAGRPIVVRLVFPCFWRIESAAARADAVWAANLATSATPLAKVYLTRDGRNTTAAVEMLCADPAEFAGAFPAAMGALRTAVRAFAAGLLVARRDPGAGVA